jgi:hypothetical protein
LTLDSGAYYPQSANHLLVSLNGVIQAPQDSFTVSGSQIIFDSALTSADVIDFIIALGDTLDIGVPSAGSVNTSQLANDAVTSAKLDTNIDVAGTLDVTGVLTADSNVQVGKTSSDYQAVGVEAKTNGSLWATADGNGPLIVVRKTSDGTLTDFYRDTTQVGSIGVSGANNIYISGKAASHSGLTFATNQILPTAEGSITDGAESLGSSSNRFSDLYLSGGVYVGGTGSANYLDDYEEGTATVTLNGGSTTPTPRLQTTAYYTKIGPVVHVHFEFNNVTTTSYSGQISIFGLPFAASSPSGTTTRQVSGDVQTYNMGSFTANESGGLFFRISEGGTEVYLWSGRSANTWEAVTHSAGSSRYLIGGITYTTDS